MTGRAALGLAAVLLATGPAAVAHGAVAGPGEHHPRPGGGSGQPGGDGWRGPRPGTGRYPGEGRHPGRGKGPGWYGPYEPPTRGGDEPGPAEGGGSSDDPGTARCLPSAGTCTVSLSGPDTNFRVSAHSGDRATQLRAQVDGGSRPICPGYRPQGSDWVTFGFSTGESGASWAKTVSLTTHRHLTESAADALAQQMQICFEAPYQFETRSGYDSAERGLGHDGVLPDCSGAGPCVSDRSVIQTGHGWVVRLTFRIPAGPADPKALG